MTAFREIVQKNRSYRRFRENEPVDRETVLELVDLARLVPSAANLQPLKYLVSCDPARNEKIFSCLNWAGYLKKWPGPEKGERPAAYVVVLLDTDIAESPGFDPGISVQTLLLGAVERGLGGCMIGSVNRTELAKTLGLPDSLQIYMVVALGVPAENVVLETLDPEKGVRYWRDADGTHHVPKRALDEVIVDI
jgi:nitroreductase